MPPRAISYVILAIAAAITLTLFAASLTTSTTHHTHPSTAIAGSDIAAQPAGLAYSGPPTTAIAGWYCVAETNNTVAGKPISQGCNEPLWYDVQLNALLNNGTWIAWIQDAMLAFPCTGPCPGYVLTLTSQYWVENSTSINYVGDGGAILNGSTVCGWLVITVKNGTAYVGYSTDGKHVKWVSEHQIGEAVIIPSPFTQLVLTAPRCTSLNKTIAYLALYYWNGTTWEPAPVNTSYPEGTEGWTIRTWVLTNGTACGTISWLNPTNQTQCPPSPSFTPTPSK